MALAVKTASQQEYAARLNRVLDHIDKNLGEELSLSLLAGIAQFSEYRFHRIFRSLMGQALNEFITRLRLERAIWMLRHTPGYDLTAIAVECGFNSLSNFSRTFKKHFDVSPGRIEIDEFLKKSKIGQTFPIGSRYYLQAFPADERGLDCPVTVERFDDLRIAYIRCYGLYLDAQKGIDAYRRLMAWANANGVFTPDTMVIGMSPDDPEITPLEKCRYDFCVTLKDGIRPEGEIGVTTIPSADQAVHHCEGDIHKFDQAWQYFFKVWLPSSGYQPAQQPAMEIYRALPEEIGWETFNIDCCVPVTPPLR
jgi:AraC family transcriptional regulator